MAYKWGVTNYVLTGMNLQVCTIFTRLRPCDDHDETLGRRPMDTLPKKNND